MDTFEILGIGLALIAIIISFWRFKREIKIEGPIIDYLSRQIIPIDADHSALRGDRRWHFQFDLIFYNRGDRTGVAFIDAISSKHFETFAEMTGKMRVERQFPKSILIRDKSLEKIRFGGYVNRFDEEIEDDLSITFRTWRKKPKKGIKKLFFWEEPVLDEIDLGLYQKVVLFSPKRTKEGTDERVQKIKEQEAKINSE